MAHDLDLESFEDDFGETTIGYDQPEVRRFAFTGKRFRIDWRRLHNIDIDRVLMHTDVESLNSVMDVVAFGDLDAEDPLNLNEINFVRIFRLAQLCVEYLLWAQDNLHGHNKYLMTQLNFYEKYLAALRLKCREYKTHLRAAKAELKRQQKHIKTFHLLALMGKDSLTAFVNGPRMPLGNLPNINITNQGGQGGGGGGGGPGTGPGGGGGVPGGFGSGGGAAGAAGGTVVYIDGEALDITALVRRLEQLRTELKEKEERHRAQMEAARLALEVKNREMSDLVGENDALRAEITRLREEHFATYQELNHQRELNQEMDNRLDQLRRVARVDPGARVGLRLAELEAALQDRDRENRALQDRLYALDSERDPGHAAMLESDLDEARGEAQDLRRRLRAAEDDAEQARRQLEGLRAAQAQGEVSEALKAELDRRDAERRDMREKLFQEQSAKEAAERELRRSVAQSVAQANALRLSLAAERQRASLADDLRGSLAAPASAEPSMVTFRSPRGSMAARDRYGDGGRSVGGGLGMEPSTAATLSIGATDAEDESNESNASALSDDNAPHARRPPPAQRAAAQRAAQCGPPRIRASGPMAFEGGMAPPVEQRPIPSLSSLPPAPSLRASAPSLPTPTPTDPLTPGALRVDIEAQLSAILLQLGVAPSAEFLTNDQYQQAMRGLDAWRNQEWAGLTPEERARYEAVRRELDSEIDRMSRDSLEGLRARAEQAAAGALRPNPVPMLRSSYDGMLRESAAQAAQAAQQDAALRASAQSQASETSFNRGLGPTPSSRSMQAAAATVPTGPPSAAAPPPSAAPLSGSSFRAAPPAAAAASPRASGSGLPLLPVASASSRRTSDVNQPAPTAAAAPPPAPMMATIGPLVPPAPPAAPPAPALAPRAPIEAAGSSRQLAPIAERPRTLFENPSLPPTTSLERPAPQNEGSADTWSGFSVDDEAENTTAGGGGYNNNNNSTAADLTLQNMSDSSASLIRPPRSSGTNNLLPPMPPPSASASGQAPRGMSPAAAAAAAAALSRAHSPQQQPLPAPALPPAARTSSVGGAGSRIPSPVLSAAAGGAFSSSQLPPMASAGSSLDLPPPAPSRQGSVRAPRLSGSGGLPPPAIGASGSFHIQSSVDRTGEDRLMLSSIDTVASPVRGTGAGGAVDSGVRDEVSMAGGDEFNSLDQIDLPE